LAVFAVSLFVAIIAENLQILQAGLEPGFSVIDVVNLEKGGDFKATVALFSVGFDFGAAQVEPVIGL
jgi:hypothetical protein